MIISRTPFRISFLGGGTDYPTFYEENGGAVLSTTINKYCYITCRYTPPFLNYKYAILYRKREETCTISEIEHSSVRECLNFVNMNSGVEIQYNADLPAMSGLGSSSSFTVGLLNALNALNGTMSTKRRLALDAIHIEQEVLRENVGSQDQTIAAFGGLNKIEFGNSPKIAVYPVTIKQDTIDSLYNHLMLYFTGFSRNASEIAAEQLKITSQKKSELTALRTMVDEAVNILKDGRDNIMDFGKLLHESWQIKRSLTPQISTSMIDEIYQAGLEAGASGGKLLGAGGGGFILFFVPPELRDKVKKKLEKLLFVPFKFETLGSQIIYYMPEDNY